MLSVELSTSTMHVQNKSSAPCHAAAAECYLHSYLRLSCQRAAPSLYHGNLYSNIACLITICRACATHIVACLSGVYDGMAQACVVQAATEPATKTIEAYVLAATVGEGGIALALQVSLCTQLSFTCCLLLHMCAMSGKDIHRVALYLLLK